MRRMLVVAVALLLTAAVFADDALVLPKGVVRARFTAAYSMADQNFDSDGEKVDMAVGAFGTIDSINAFNIGAALEYGVIEGVNVAFQWIPGAVVWSKATSDSALLENVSGNGLYDLFAGAKVQLIGEQGVVQKNQQMRFAAAAGLVIPLPGQDWDKQSKNLRADIIAGGGDDSFTLQDADRHAWGIGGRGYFDYIVNKMIFVNLYGEFIKYINVKKESLGFGTGVATPKQEYDFGYQLTLELEPHFETPVAQGFLFKAGLPVTYVTSPETELEGVGLEDENYSVTIRPNVAMFMTKLPLPIEVELGYLYPLAGKNVNATSAVTFQLKAFAKF